MTFGREPIPEHYAGVATVMYRGAQHAVLERCYRDLVADPAALVQAAEVATRSRWDAQVSLTWIYGRTLIGSALVAAHVVRILADADDEPWADQLGVALRRLDWADLTDQYARQGDGLALLRLRDGHEGLRLVGRYLSIGVGEQLGPVSGQLVRYAVTGSDNRLRDLDILATAWHAVYGLAVLAALAALAPTGIPGRPTVAEQHARRPLVTAARRCVAAGHRKLAVAQRAGITRPTLDAWLGGTAK